MPPGEKLKPKEGGVWRADPEAGISPAFVVSGQGGGGEGLLTPTVPDA